MRKALVLVAAVLLSGCASEEPPSTTATVAGEMPGVPSSLLAPPTPLRFASGDYAGTLSGDASFSIAEQCVFITGDGCAGGEQVFDLSEIIPAEAPVELVVEVHGARASLEFIDASYLGEAEAEFQGQGTSFANIVVRGQSGQVLLHVYNPGGFGFPPNPNPTASFDANTLVRSDRLVADVPASLKMSPGQSINLTNEDVEEAILIAPDGTMTRDTTAPFTLMANGTAGIYTVIMGGQGSTAITGPDVPLTARRISRVESEPVPLTSGSSTAWSFTPESRPLQVGLEISPMPTVGFWPIGTTVTEYQATLTGPGNILFVDESDACAPTCGFIVAGGEDYAFSSAWLDERLQAGAYDVSVSYTGNGMQASTWHIVLA